jgi:hypothetical protein
VTDCRLYYLKALVEGGSEGGRLLCSPPKEGFASLAEEPLRLLSQRSADWPARDRLPVSLGIVRDASLEELYAGPGHHHTIVSAERRWRQRHLPLGLPPSPSLRELLVGSVSDVTEHLPQRLIRGHASDNDQLADGRLSVVKEADGAREAVVQMGEGGGLEGGA